MKIKIKFLITALLLGCFLGMNAQENSSVWKRNRFIGLNFVSSDLSVGDFPGKLKSSYGFAFNNGTTYLLHKKPFWGVLKIGLDATWIDINYVKYQSTGIYDNGYHGGYGNYGDYGSYEDYLDDEGLGTGTHKLDIGLGVGPSLVYAPFVNKTNALKDLKAKLYVHFTPSASALIIDEGGDSSVHWGFSPVINFGGLIQWKMLGIGAEGRWSSSKYSGIDVEDIEDGSSSSKTNIKISSCRVFIRLCF